MQASMPVSRSVGDILHLSGVMQKREHDDRRMGQSSPYAVLEAVHALSGHLTTTSPVFAGVSFLTLGWDGTVVKLPLCVGVRTVEKSLFNGLYVLEFSTVTYD